MALRLVALLALLTLTALAGCSDGPPAGDLVAIPGTVSTEGAIVNTYTPRSGGQPNPAAGAAGEDYYCPVEPGNNVPPIPPSPAVEPCVDPSSNYAVHFMSLPEPSGDGYSIYQVGGAIGERSLMNLQNGANGMWDGNITLEEDQTGTFDHFELRMGSSFVVARAAAAAGSQAFVPEATLSTVSVTGSYKGHKLTIDVQGLPEGMDDAVGRLYLRTEDGNLSAPQETFTVVPGVQEYVSENANIGDYAEFHIHVGTSKIYLYQGTLD